MMNSILVSTFGYLSTIFAVSVYTAVCWFGPSQDPQEKSKQQQQVDQTVKQESQAEEEAGKEKAGQQKAGEETKKPKKDDTFHPVSVTTAEEYLKLLNQNKLFFGKLDKQESEKVAQYLRKQYPFESIERRMAFETDHPKRLAAHHEKHAKSDGDLDVPDHSHRYSRTAALEKLHSDAVEKFVNADMFGLSRMPQVNPRTLMAKQYDNKILLFESNSHEKYQNEKSVNLPPVANREVKLAQLKSQREQLLIKHPKDISQVVQLQKQIKQLEDMDPESIKRFPAKDHLISAHDYSARLFTNEAGFAKSLKEVSGFRPHMIYSNTVAGFLKTRPPTPEPGRLGWQLNRLELVSLLKHDQPRVYVSDQLPNMKNLDDHKSRALNDFEDQSLKKFFQGENTVIQATTNRIQMLGALRAQDSCLKCHRVKKNDLLGAFSYEVLRRGAK